MNAVIVTKRKNWWTKFFIQELNYNFKIVKNFNIELLTNYTSQEIVNKINSFITKSKIDIIFFEGDFPTLISKDFIESIECGKKVLLSLDADENAKINNTTLLSCDALIATCPYYIRNLRRGLQTKFFLVENNSKIFKNLRLKKKYDVIFFGELKSDRQTYLKFLSKNGINVKVLGTNSKNFLTYKKLVKYINQSKIVLNFSKGDVIKKYNYMKNKKSYYQFKGRILIAGLCNSLCVSEFTPQSRFIFNKNEMPMFNNQFEMLKILNKLLNNKYILNNLTHKFIKKCVKYSSSKKSLYSKNLFSFFKKIKQNRKVSKNPFWYDFYFFKQKFKFYKKSSLKIYFKEALNIFLSNLRFNFFSILLVLTFFPFFIYFLIGKLKY